jgi:hypothetical protein
VQARHALVIVLLAGLGCSRGQAALNPKYAKAGSVPGPVLVLPITECKHTERGEKDQRQRELFLATAPAELWRAARQTGEPQLDTTSYSNPLCEELYLDEFAGFEMNARLRKAVKAKLEGRTEQSILLVTYFFPYECAERTGTVRNRNGAVVGTVGTGRDDCWETDLVTLNAVLLTATDVAWFMSANMSGEYKDATTAANELFGTGFPHDAVQTPNP